MKVTIAQEEADAPPLGTAEFYEVPREGDTVVVGGGTYEVARRVWKVTDDETVSVHLIVKGSRSRSIFDVL